MQRAVKSTRLRIEPTDEMLIEHSRHGNLEAFEEIFYRYCRPLYEYVFLITCDVHLSEKIAFKAFVRFFRFLPRFRFERQVLAELLEIASRFAVKAYKGGEVRESNFHSQDRSSSVFETLSLEDRAVFVLGKKYSLNLGDLSRICRRRPLDLMRRLDQLEAQLGSGIEKPRIEFPPFDYRASLRSRIQRVRQERTSGRMLVFGGAVLILTFVLYAVFFFLSRPRDLVENRFNKREAVRPPQTTVASAQTLNDVWVQNLQRDRHSFFERQRGFAEESLVFLPGKGKVLAVDYELFKEPTRAGLAIQLDQVDLSRFVALNFSVKGDPGMGFPKSMAVYVRDGSRGISGPHFVPVEAVWQTLRIPLGFKGKTPANELEFAFDNQTVGPQRSGRVYLDRIGFSEAAKS